MVSIINHWILEYLRYTLISIRISLEFFCHTAKKQHLFGGDPLSTFDLFMSDGSPQIIHEIESEFLSPVS